MDSDGQDCNDVDGLRHRPDEPAVARPAGRRQDQKNKTNGDAWVLNPGYFVDRAAVAAGVGGAAGNSSGYNDKGEGVVGAPGEHAEAAVAGGSEPTGKQRISSSSRNADCFAFSSTK